MPKPKMVAIRNGDLTGVCTESALKAWKEHGWTAVDDGTSDTGTRVQDEPVDDTVSPCCRTTPRSNDGSHHP